MEERENMLVFQFEYQKENDEKKGWMDGWMERERLTEVLGSLCLEVLSSCYYHHHHHR